jgi:hypothetical protein
MGHTGDCGASNTDLLSHGNSPVNGTVLNDSIHLLKYAQTVRSQIKLRLQSKKNSHPEELEMTTMVNRKRFIFLTSVSELQKHILLTGNCSGMIAKKKPIADMII